MRAAILRGPYDLKVENVPIPSVKPGQVLVNVKETAVCGTDIGIYNGEIPTEYPIIQGHEAAGVVSEVGEGVTSIAKGDRVIINPAISCTKCHYCFSGKTNLCENGGLLGREMNGTFSEYVIVPDYSLIKLPDEISYEEATTISGLTTVLRAHDKVKITAGQSVAVIGLGTTGLLNTNVSVIAGAGKVFGITRSQWKLDIAEKFGAIPINPTEVDAVEAVKNATGGAGADLVIECVGNSATLRQAMDMVRPGGTVLLFGIGGDKVDGFNAYDMYFKEITLVGTRAMTRRDFVHGLELVMAKKIDLSPYVTHRFSLEDTKEALDLIDKKSAKDVLRVVVKSDN